ncbi:hypothetical protein UlMin_036603 [Ulmus minor]
MEFVRPEGLHLDGRHLMEANLSRAWFVTKADGFNSALSKMGNTKVIADVYGPREVHNRSQQLSDQALVCYEYNMANFSTRDRIRKPKGDMRSTEISLFIHQTMEACILTHLTPQSQIYIFVQVMQADGGWNAASMSHLHRSFPLGFVCGKGFYSLPIFFFCSRFMGLFKENLIIIYNKITIARVGLKIWRKISKLVSDLELSLCLFNIMECISFQLGFCLACWVFACFISSKTYDYRFYW